MDTDEVLAQLRKLREGVGLSADKLNRRGAVMSALGTSDPHEGHERLLTILNDLAPDERTKALFVDYGVDLTSLLGREPTARECQWLGDRRSTFASLIGRDVKTLRRWSDTAIAELRAKLLADQFTGDLFVVAAVDGERIASCTVTERDLGQRGKRIAVSNSFDFENPTQQASMPCLVYAFPRDSQPATLTLAVTFRRKPYPTKIWATVARSFLEISFGEERYELPLDNDTATCKIVNPRRDRLYGVWWRF